MIHPRIFGIGTANPPPKLSQEQAFHAAGYEGERIRKIFLNSDIDYRHFYLEGALNREETSDQLNQRYLRGGRCSYIAGDFFESIPSGGDAYLLCGVVHDWDDNRVITLPSRLLKN